MRDLGVVPIGNGSGSEAKKHRLHAGELLSGFQESCGRLPDEFQRLLDRPCGGQRRYHKKKRHWKGRPVKPPENPQEVMHQVVESAAAWTCKHKELDRRLQSNQRRPPAALRKESLRTLDDLMEVARQLRRRLGRGP